MEVGDTLYCRVQLKAQSGLILNVVAVDPITGKSRYQYGQHSIKYSSIDQLI